MTQFPAEKEGIPEHHALAGTLDALDLRVAQCSWIVWVGPGREVAALLAYPRRQQEGVCREVPVPRVEEAL